jgi:hypothetical protein
MALSIEDKARLVQLSSDLSPENLHCDGEISRAAAERKRKIIMREWRELEAKHGQELDEEDASRFFNEVRRWRETQRTTEMAQLPRHPLVASKNPGVYVREGKSGSAAYYIWGPGHGSAVEFELFSEFAYKFGLAERIAKFKTLDLAVEAGEAFLATVGPEMILAKYPRSTPETIKRELERLPEGYAPALPEMPPVTGFDLRVGNEVIAHNVKAEDVGGILVKTLIERGQHCNVTSVG